ncbi:MAG: biotin-dependent carboxyltransferase family protein [Phaeodactylibacter sp.]|uniref:5-oxoprolinase subunit C family protein n=1 Tax=Phaeodactylibacter sp. TaxID=1940289 RepID=UPI0032EC077A
MPEIEIGSTGWYDTLQDEGRPGYQSFGVPVGGAMDRRAAALANQLVHNPLSTPVLESTLMGPRLRFHTPAQIALTGASIQPQLNGAPVPTYTTLTVGAGSVLEVGRMEKGCRTYLAVHGEWQVPKWLGSCSPPPFQADQLTPASVIRPHQRIHIKAGKLVPIRAIELKNRPAFPQQRTVGVLPGPEWPAFSRLAIARFFGKAFTVSNEANRMGLRLKETVEHTSTLGQLISSAVLPGTVQLPPSGQPIILMADAQTTGGYPRLVQVLADDLPILAQLRPGDRIRFTLPE